jgi:hypothetical protein
MRPRSPASWPTSAPRPPRPSRRQATTQEEREAALAEVDDDEEPINRGLLLKFLGSVNG